MLRAAILILACSAAAAQSPPPVEAYFAVPQVIDVELSPSGRHLAVTSQQGRPKRIGLFVIDLKAVAREWQRLAHYKLHHVSSFRWVNDEQLVFELEHLKPDPHARASGLYTVGLDGEQAEPLRGQTGRRGNVLGLAGLLGGPQLLEVPRANLGAEGTRTEDIIFGEPETAFGKLVHLRPWRMNVRTGVIRPVATATAPARVVRWWFLPNGEPQLAMSQDQERITYHWRTTDAQGVANWRPIGEGTIRDGPFEPVWVGPDRLLVATPSGVAGESVVVPFDFQRGVPGEKPVVNTPGFDFEGRVLDTVDGRMVGVRLQADAEHTVWLDPALQALQALADARLPGRVNRLSCRRCSADDAVVLVRSYSDREPGELWLHTKADGRWSLVTRLMPGIDAARMASTDLHRITTRDGRLMPVWTTGQRQGPDGRPLAQPAVVLVHGGPWVRNGYWRWEPMRQFLASRGYLVIEPEFRGSDGYGQAHLRAGFKQWGKAMQDDVADALLWARAQGWAGDKACIAGASYGGYSTLMGLVRHPELYRCGAAWVAVTDPVLYVGGSWVVSDDISSLVRRHQLHHMVGDPKTDAADLEANSPVAQAHRIRAPLLLAFGELDERVPLAHGRRLRQALKDAGRPAPEWVVYDDEAHGWSQEENQIDFAKRLERFLDKHLK